MKPVLLPVEYTDFSFNRLNVHVLGKGIPDDRIEYIKQIIQAETTAPQLRVDLSNPMYGPCRFCKR